MKPPSTPPPPSIQSGTNQINQILQGHQDSTRCPDAIITIDAGVSPNFSPVRTLCDTGASFSCISKTCVDQLIGNGIPVQISDSDWSAATAANGASMKIIGECFLDLRFSGKVNGKPDEIIMTSCKFRVFHDLSSPLILGVENLRLLDFEVNPDKVKIGPARMHVTSLRPEFEGKQILSLKKTVVQDDTRWCVYGTEDTVASLNDSMHDEGVAIIRREMEPLLLISLQKNQEVPNEILVDQEPLESGDKINSKDAVLDESNTNSASPIRPGNPTGIAETDQSKNMHSSDANKNSEELLKTTLEDIVLASEFTESGKRKLRTILMSNLGVFSTNDTDVGEYSGAEITLEQKKGEEKAVYVPSRRIPYALRAWLSQHLEKSLKAGIIEYSNGSEFNSPLFIVPKPNGKGHRPVSDFRLLNNTLKDNHFPVPFIRDLLDRLHDKRFFSTWDLRSGFYNLKIEKESRPLTAFTVMGRCYQFIRLAQGLKIAPAVFQREVLRTTGDLVPDQASVYLDDLITYSNNQESALRVIEQILDRFKTAGFKFNPSKCLLGKKRIQYLGYDISHEGWKPTAEKVKAIDAVQEPETVTELRRFLGMVNFHGINTPRLQVALQPLNQLTGGKAKKDLVEWTDEAKQAFRDVKQLIKQSIQLAFFSPDLQDTLILTTDASLKGYGCILSQVCNRTQKERILGCTSGSFKGAQLNWPIYECEMFAFVEGLKSFDTYCFGRMFIWRTDNKALSFFRTEGTVRRDALRLSPKVSRWIEFIEGFSFTVEHFSGTTDEMSLADLLSRSQETVAPTKSVSSILNELETGLPNHLSDYCLQAFPLVHPKPVVASLKEDQIIIKKFNLRRDLWFEIWSRLQLRIADIQDAQVADKDLDKLTGVYNVLQKDRYQLSTKLGLKFVKYGTRWLVILPVNLLPEAFANSHGPAHHGFNFMAKSLRESFWIPDLQQRLTEFLKSCPSCVQVKARPAVPSEPVLQTSSVAPWQSVHIDLCGPMPRSYEGNCYILVIIDSLTRFAEAEALKDKTAESVIEAVCRICARRGFPGSMLSDNGSEFKNQYFRDFLRKAGCLLQQTTPYQPQSNGLVERCNAKIKKLLKLWQCDDLNWESYLSAIMYVINNSYNRNIQSSPWLNFHGWTNHQVYGLRDVVKEGYSPKQSTQWTEDFIRRRNSELSRLVGLDRQRKLTEYDKLLKCYSKRKRKEIQVGDLVLLYTFQPHGRCAKLYQNWRGLYRVWKKCDKNVYEIGLEGHARRRFIVHRNRLRLVERPAKFQLPTDQYSENEQARRQDIAAGDSFTPQEDHYDQNEEKEPPAEDGYEEVQNSSEEIGSEEPTQGGRLRSGKLFTKYD